MTKTEMLCTSTGVQQCKCLKLKGIDVVHPYSPTESGRYLKAPFSWSGRNTPCARGERCKDLR